jgi:hypothetical protein
MTLHTPWRYPYGIGAQVTMRRVYPPQLGAGVDCDEFGSEYIVIVGVGLWWLFVTVSVMWWVPPKGKV